MLYPVCATVLVKAQVKNLIEEYSHRTDAKTCGTALIREPPCPSISSARSEIQVLDRVYVIQRVSHKQRSPILLLCCHSRKCTPAASCTGVFLRALILTDMAWAAAVYLGFVSTSIKASLNAGLPIWEGLKRSPKPCVMTEWKSARLSLNNPCVLGIQKYPCQCLLKQSMPA